MKKQGFTIVELLSVIIIIAIIALIATPIVMNIIEKTRKSTAEKSISNIEHVAEVYYYDKKVNGHFTGTTFTCNGKNCSNGVDVLAINGDIPTEGKIMIDQKGNVTLKAMLINEYACSKEDDKYNCIKTHLTPVNSDNSNIIITDNNLEVFSDYKVYGNTYQKTRSGKNLFDISQGITLLPTSAAYIENNILYTSYSSGNSRGCYFDQYIEVTPNTTYTYNHDYTGGDRVVIMIYDENKNLIEDSSISIGSNWTFLANYDGYYGSGKNHSVTIPENIKYVRFAYINMNTVGEGNYNSYYNIQFEKGTNATEYEPYGKMPSLEFPSEVQSVGDLVTEEGHNKGKYEIPIKVTGKNLFDIDKFLSLNENSTYYKKDENNHLIQITSDYRDRTALPILITLPAGTYTVSGLNTTNYYFYSVNTGVAYGKKIVLTEKTDIAFKTWESANFDLGKIQIEEGTTPTEYEPYMGEEYNIYLDEPLRKIGDHADYIDLKKGNVVRNIKQVIFNGNENFTDFDSNVFTTVNVDKGISSENFTLMSNLTIPVRTSTLGWRNNNVQNFQINKSWVGATTVSELQEKLQNFSNQGTPLKIFYILETPTEEMIKLPDILAIKGYNNLSIGTKINPSKMEVTYYK